MLKTSSSLAQSEEGALVEKLRESPGLAQLHVPPKFTCEVGDNGGQGAPRGQEEHPLAAGLRNRTAVPSALAWAIWY